MTHWIKGEVDFLAAHLDKDTKEIYLKFCDAYGSEVRSYDSLQKKIKKLRDAFSGEPDDEPSLESNIEQLLAGSPQELVIPDKNAERRRELKDEARWWLEGIVEASSDLVASPDLVPQGTGTALCVMLSDLHLGKHNDNFDIASGTDRLAGLANRLLAQEGSAGIDEVVLLLIGDLVEGEDIFRTQAHHIECSALEQVQACSEALWQCVLNFRTAYNCTVRLEMVPGNHGRTSRTANEKTNWDNVIHHILKVSADKHGDSDIIVNVNFDMFRIFEVKDKTGMLYHQGVKHTSTPAMREKVAGWVSKKNFDFMCHGHWHEWHVGNWLSRVVIANGCLCGPDDLAERMGKEDVARQAYFKVTPGNPLHGMGFIEWPT